MRKNRYILVWMLIAALSVSSGTVFAAVDISGANAVNEQAELEQYSDDFGNYGTGAYTLAENNLTFAGDNWRTKTTEEGLMYNSASMATYEGNYRLTGSTLEIFGSSASTGSWDNFPAAVGYMPAIISNNTITAAKQKIHVDFKKGHAHLGVAVRFMAHDNGDGYALWFKGQGQTSTPVWELYKIVQGEEPTRLTHGGGSSSYLPINVLFGLDITYSDGEIEFSLSGTKDDTEISYSGSYTDTAPFDLTDKATTLWLSVADKNGGATSSSRRVQFDNVSMSEDIPYISGEFPESYIHMNVAAGKAADDDNVIDLGAEYKIRAFQLTDMQAATVNIYVSKDRTEWHALENVTFDSDGHWINCLSSQEYRYVYIEGVDFANAAIWAEVSADATVECAIKSPVYFDIAIGGASGSDVELSVEPVLAGNVSGHSFTPLSKGDIVLSACHADDSDKKVYLNLNVLGEIELAVRNGTEEQYLVSKRPLFGALKTSLYGETASFENFKGIVRNTDEHKLQEILDFDSSKISDMADENLELFYKRLQSYDSDVYSCADIEDVSDIIDIFDNEYVVDFVCNIADADAMEYAISFYNDYYGLDLENEFYVKYKAECLGLLLDKTWDNLDGFRTGFADTYVMEALKKALSTTMVRSLVENEHDVIGYDLDKYKDNDKEELAGGILDNKDTLTSVALLKNYINGFESTKEENDSDGESSGRGPAGGGGGGGGFSGGIDEPIHIDKETFEEGIPDAQPIEVETPFSDIDKSHWAFDTVMRAKANKIADGYSDGTFLPEKEITRAEFIKLIAVAFELGLSDSEPCSFKDVEETDWCYDYVASAFYNKLITGDEAGYFNPDRNITREEACVILARLLPHKEAGIVIINSFDFTDKDNVSEWALDNVCWLASENLITGMPDGRFAPQGNTTRAEALTLIIRALDWSE